MIEHGRALDLAAAALDWDLSEAESGELAAHMATCASCRRADAIQRGQATVLRTLVYAETPVAVRQVVLTAATRRARRERRPTWALVAAAALIVLAGLASAIMVASYLLEQRRDPISVDLIERPPIRSIPSPRTVAELPFTRTIATTWGRLDEPAFHDRLGTTSLTSVVGRGSDIVAGGYGPTGAAVWRSADGLSWQRIDLPSSARLEQVLDVATDGSTIVAIGENSQTSKPIAWFSTDGASWSQATISGPPDSSMAKAVAVTDGFVATGASGEAGVPTLWRSEDGSDWRPESIEGVDGDDAAYSLAVGPGGRLVMTGSSFGAFGWAASAWYSDDDGRRWKPSSVPPVLVQGPGIDSSTFMNDVVGGPDGFVAVGEAGGPGAAAAWRSSDGVTWEGLADAPTFLAFARWGPGFVAVGASPTGTAGVWLSDDGRSWGLVESSGLDSRGLEGTSAAFNDVVVTDSRIVAVGNFPSGDPSHTRVATAWTNPAPPNPASTVIESTAHPCPTGEVGLTEVAELTPDERLACFGDQPLTLAGYVSDWGEAGGINFEEPPWLASPGALLPVASEPQRVINLELHLDPSLGSLPIGSWVRVTGNFDDPLASTCRTAAAAQLRCRQAFVVKSVTKIAPP